MKYYCIYAFPSQLEKGANPFRHKLLSVTDTPDVNTNFQVFVPVDQVIDLDKEVFSGYTGNDVIKDFYSTVTQLDIPIFRHDPNTGTWTLDLDLQTIKNIRVSKDRRGYGAIFEAVYPIVKQTELIFKKEEALNFINKNSNVSCSEIIDKILNICDYKITASGPFQARSIVSRTLMHFAPDIEQLIDTFKNDQVNLNDLKTHVESLVKWGVYFLTARDFVANLSKMEEEFKNITDPETIFTYHLPEFLSYV
jgi:hypothetical protein